MKDLNLSNTSRQLFEYLEKNNISIYKFSKESGIPKGRIYQWQRGNGNPKGDDIKIIDKYLVKDVSREPELNEPIPNYLNSRRNQKNELKPKKTIPFYDAEATATLTETEMTPIHAPAGTIDIGDLLHDSQAAIRIYGNSMLPNYPPGCVVGLAKVGKESIQPGEVYVIETKEERILKRLFYKDDNPESEHFLLYSDNTIVFDGGARHGKLAYPPSLKHKGEIVNLFSVTGVIKRNSNSIIINR